MLTSSTEARTDITVLRLVGVLDAGTYRQVRDAVIMAAIDASAVIIDVDGLKAGEEYAWTVFTSARWHVQQWPETPVALVSGDPAVRKRLAALPVYFSVDAARDAIGAGRCRYRHRAREQFGPHSFSVQSALIFMREHLMAWSMPDKIPVASTVVTVFAENALSYTRHGFDVRLEAAADEVVVAVSDAGSTLAVRRERPLGSSPAGLDIVAALCRRWGNTPTSGGKTVWARIGPDDSFAGITQLFQ